MNSPHEAQSAGPPAARRPAEYTSVKVRNILRREAQKSAGWYWTINPYQGCELACTFCSARLDERDFGRWLDFEKRIGVKANAVQAFLSDIRAEDFEGRSIVLGTSSEPWQPVEEKLRVTRALLKVMAQVDGIDLRINTRSSLIAQDIDLLKAIAAKGRVSVTFSIASLDERVNRLMEPKAPSAFRRLAALEALARSGIEVGLNVAPVFAGLDEEELGLAGLLGRAAHAGARFAGMRFLELEPGQRETFLSHVTRAFPDQASRFRRIIGRRTPTDEEQQELMTTFRGLCEKVGLQPVAQAVAPRAPEPRPEPAQLPLFA